MRIIILLLFQVLLSNQIVIDLITTNDIHGVIQDQKAYFMNPQYPPNIVGGAGLYNYMNNLNDENLIVLDGGNFFQLTQAQMLLLVVWLPVLLLEQWQLNMERCVL